MKFGSKEEIVKAIEAHFQRMQQGRLGMQDLEELVEQARELYERVLVLRYKAYEEKVFGEAKEILEQHEAEIINVDESLDESYAEQEEEPAGASEAVFDFSLFDEAETTHTGHSGEIPAFAEQHETEEKTQFVTMDTDPPYDSEVVAETHTSDPVSDPEPDTPVHLQDDMFNHILEENDRSRMLGSKLDTLVGAFGFNEKFQCIHELFKGSSDDFNQAVDVLDNMQTFEEAKQQLQFYVHLHHWDLNSEITAEFVRKVERRFR